MEHSTESVVEDVRKFKEFVNLKIEDMTFHLEKVEKPTLAELRNLADFTLARLMTFNARRGSECSKSTLDHWKGVEDGRWKNQEALKNLDNVEKQLAKRLQLCYVEGKKKAKTVKRCLVPILFTDEVVKAIRLLVKYRHLMPIPKTNIYIFAAGESYLKGWNTLQKITKDIVSLEKPKLITPTRTRKYLATMLQLLDMNDAELTWLTNHFGHSKDVHHQWYRQEESTIELTKVARVLCAVDEGKTIKNKKIDQIGCTERDEPTNRPKTSKSFNYFFTFH